MDFFKFDDDYVRRLRERDPLTVEHFVSYFGRLMLIKLRSRLRSMDAIDEVRQETFRRVFAALDKGEPRESAALGAFVSTVCNHVYLEYVRQTKRSEPLDEKRHDRATGENVEEALATAETVARVRHVLDEMEPKDAAILTALYLNEETKDEICARFGCTRDYLRVLLHRARKAFRDKFGDRRPPSA